MPYMRPPLSKDIWYTDDDGVVEKHSFKQWSGKEKRFGVGFHWRSFYVFCLVYIFLMKNFIQMLKHLMNKKMAEWELFSEEK